MIDGVILVAIMIPVFIGIFQFMLTMPEGTKGIKEKEYKTKDGKTHTALKSRENYIV